MNRIIFLKIVLLFHCHLALGLNAWAAHVNAEEDDDLDLSSHFWIKKSVTASPIIPENEVGGVILSDGNLTEIKDFIENGGLHATPYFREFSMEEVFDLLEKEENTPVSLLKTATPATFHSLGNYMGKQLDDAGLTGCIVTHRDFIGKERFEVFLKGLKESGISAIADSYDDLHLEESQSQVANTLLKPKKQAQAFHLNDGFFVHALMDSSSWILDWLNHDVLVINEDQIAGYRVFAKKVKSNKWYRRIAAKKTKKNATWTLFKQHDLNALEKKNSSKWPNIHQHLIEESIVLIENKGNIPFNSLEEKFVFLGPSTFEPMLRSISRYIDIKQISWQTFDEQPGYALTELSESQQLIAVLRSKADIEKIKKIIGPSLEITLVLEKVEQAKEVLGLGTIALLNGVHSEQLDIAGQVFFGGIGAKGYIPSDINKEIKRGEGTITDEGTRLAYRTSAMVGIDQQVLNKITPIISESIQQGAFPGCQIAIVKGNSLIYERSFGYFTYDSIFPVQKDHLYDLASVTKVTATLQAVMFLQEQGLISLEDELGKYLPDLKGSNKEHMLIKEILVHEAGLKPYLPFWKVSLKNDRLSTYVYQSAYDSLNDIKTYGLYRPTPQEKKKVWAEIIDSDLRKLNKGDSTYNYRYSDLGFMLLQMLVEKVSNQPLDVFVKEHIYRPLGLRHMMFNPMEKFPREQIVPTEYDYYFRNAQVWGTVHDQNAEVLGGVAGHAGLFSNAHDLGKLLQMNLNGGKYGGYRFLHDQTLQFFTSKQKKDNRRGLGWDKPGLKDGNTSSFVSPLTYGHTGFTGTAVWVDPVHDLIYVFLSNRVYPSAENKKLMENNIRIRIQDVIYEAMGIKI